MKQNSRGKRARHCQRRPLVILKLLPPGDYRQRKQGECGKEGNVGRHLHCEDPEGPRKDQDQCQACRNECRRGQASRKEKQRDDCDCRRNQAQCLRCMYRSAGGADFPERHEERSNCRQIHQVMRIEQGVEIRPLLDFLCPIQTIPDLLNRRKRQRRRKSDEDKQH